MFCLSFLRARVRILMDLNFICFSFICHHETLSMPLTISFLINILIILQRTYCVNIGIPPSVFDCQSMHLPFHHLTYVFNLNLVFYIKNEKHYFLYPYNHEFSKIKNPFISLFDFADKKV
ncbi:hypothetical protein HZS_6769 [Henneguya salminicola]|nr:hypothetical protein HZS_6769 [Henneguya salminicola]